MDAPAQALAYARADFRDVNAGFVLELLARFPDPGPRIIDLGCGPADIPCRLGEAVPGVVVIGVDASLAMLSLARQAIAARPVALVGARLPELPFSRGSFDAVISNSLLHHLPDPGVFWREVQRVARPGAALHVMDLYRPESREQARRIVEAAAGDADMILKEDFFNSLLAALTVDEVQAQLAEADLSHLPCRVVSERHWLVSGRV